MAQTISIRGTKAGLGGREREVMLAQALEERTHGVDVDRWAESKTITSPRQAATCSKTYIFSLIALTNYPGGVLLPWGMTSHS